jgi:hypothetical protein
MAKDTGVWAGMVGQKLLIWPCPRSTLAKYGTWAQFSCRTTKTRPKAIV